MAKTYNKSKHFDLDYFRTKGLAFFDTLDFSNVSNEEIKNIIDCGVSEVEFYQCIFKDLDLSGTEFNQMLSFTQCNFSGNTNFEKCVFHKDTSFMHISFTYPFIMIVSRIYRQYSAPYLLSKLIYLE